MTTTAPTACSQGDFDAGAVLVRPVDKGGWCDSDQRWLATIAKPRSLELSKSSMSLNLWDLGTQSVESSSIPLPCLAPRFLVPIER